MIYGSWEKSIEFKKVQMSNQTMLICANLNMEKKNLKELK